MSNHVHILTIFLIDFSGGLNENTSIDIHIQVLAPQLVELGLDDVALFEFCGLFRGCQWGFQNPMLGSLSLCLQLSDQM